ncbi:hypothetical protein PRVXH_002540 [Proteinivorax hydrogeniformans]|uniref:Peptidase S12 Pab87-related C-terminal domain-containing protein n=1 Tax=Proteinivorax hydrogeniformans TaxID=1826727 RepID=A0AAU8HSQ0_9FIRM
MLSNVSGVSAAKIWQAAVNTTLGLPINQESDIPTRYKMKAKEIDSLVGTYQSAEGQKLIIKTKDGRPVCQLGDKSYDLIATAKDTLMLSKRGRKIKFYFDEKGKAWGVLLGMRILQRQDL